METVIRVEKLHKTYRRGRIGSGSLSRELQSAWAKLRGRSDPNMRLGSQVRAEFQALSDINFEIHRGEVVGIIGRNGAGKSTLLKIISRITAPSEGAVYIRGSVSSMLEIGTGFHAELTGRENIYLNGAILGMARKEIDEKIADIIRFSECEDFIDTPVKRYSSGMYVKLAFAVASHLNSDILILDEVLAVGDAQFRQKCMEKIMQLAVQNGKTVLYVSHNMTTVRQICSRVLVLEQGKIKFDGDTEEGIRAYLNTDSAQNRLDYTQPELVLRRTGRLVEPILAVTAEQGECVTDTLRVHLKWKNIAPAQGLGVRLTVYDAERRAIASGLASEIASDLQEGAVCEKTVGFDVGMLADGTYETQYTFFSAGRNAVDGVCVQGLSFTKETAMRAWNSRLYGSGILPRTEIE